MNDYSKYDFYHYKDSEDDTYHYFIKVDKKMIEVSKEVYYVCYNSYRKQLRDNRKDEKNGLISYDATNLDGYSLKDRMTYVNDDVEEDERL